MEKIPINEEMHLEKEWFAEAHKQTMDTLPAFMDKIMNGYSHDYGTICHAVAACAIAAAWAANSAPSGGITGFQAGFVMWDFVEQWSFSDNECGLRIVDYDKMLYPQYGYEFKKTISPDTWKRIKEKAKEKLASDGDSAHPDVVRHWMKIVDSDVPPFGYVVKEE